MKRNPDPDDRNDPQLIDVKRVAAILKVSKRTVDRLRKRNEMPQPLEIGGSLRWQLQTIRFWIDQGCPRQQ